MTKFIKGRFLKGNKPHNAGVRDEAKIRGDLRYFTGKPCKKGHISERSVSNGLCLECVKERMATRRKLRSKEQLITDHEKSRIRAAEWRKANPSHEGTKVAKKEYKKRNPHKVIASTAKYRAQKKHRTPSWLTVDDLWLIEQAYEIASIRTKMFGFSWHVDHVIPLTGDTVSGLHVPTNLQVIPWIDNVRKANKFIGV